ncbi:MAG: hypothetical protein ACRDQW_10875 [Haloechinothrix sp.]
MTGPGGSLRHWPTDRLSSVIIIVQYSPVPLDRRVWIECQSLVAAGFGVFVICPRGDGEPAVRRVDGVWIYDYAPPPAASGMLGYLFEFAYCGVRTALLSPVVLRRRGFDVVHVCNPPGAEPWVTSTGRDVLEEVSQWLSTAEVEVTSDPPCEFHDRSTMNKTLQCMAYAVPVVASELAEMRRSAGEAARYVAGAEPKTSARTRADRLDDPHEREVRVRPVVRRRGRPSLSQSRTAWHAPSGTDLTRRQLNRSTVAVGTAGRRTVVSRTG